MAIGNVRVDREGADLVVTWVASGDDHTVDVAVGPTPEAIDHVHALVVPAAGGTARLVGVPKGRHYVSVSPHGEGGAIVAAERVLPFESAFNFRDLGGYPVASGGHTRWGVLFRSAGLQSMTDADREAIEALGLRTIIDLRRDVELARDPTRLKEGTSIQVVRQPLISEPDDANEGGDALTRERPSDGTVFLAQLYRQMIDNAAPVLGSIVTMLSQAQTLPALFHCMAGKDRTGVLAAIVLSTVGVADDHVVDDYELTAHHRDLRRLPAVTERLVADGIPREAVAGLLASPRHLMVDLLADVRQRYGSLERYLTTKAGVLPQTIDALRTLLVVA